MRLINLSQIQLSPSPAGVRDRTKDVVLLAGAVGDPLHVFPKGQGFIQGHSQQLRVRLVTNRPVVDTDVRTPVPVCKCEAGRLALTSVKNEFPFLAPLDHDVNSSLGRSFGLLCSAYRGKEGDVVSIHCSDNVCWEEFGEFYGNESQRRNLCDDAWPLVGPV